MGRIARSRLKPATVAVPDGERVISSDLAFQGKLAYQGNYNGFRVIDVSSPGNPKLISHPKCNGDQGDIVVYEDILVRSWNTKRAEPRECGDTMVPAGFEGVHVWDISNPVDPELLGALELPCGSHTATSAGVDDGDLIVYSNNSSASGCTGGPDAGDFMDVIAVPLDDPAGMAHIRDLVAYLAAPTSRSVDLPFQAAEAVTAGLLAGVGGADLPVRHPCDTGGQGQRAVGGHEPGVEHAQTADLRLNGVHAVQHQQQRPAGAADRAQR